jgi:hypothetical protein
MDSLKPSYQIINSLAASAADLVVSDKNLAIGPAANLSPKINLSQNCKVTRVFSVVETPTVFTYTPSGTLAANTVYGFTLSQIIDGVVKTAVIEFKSGTTAPASATEVCDTLRTILAKYVQNNRVEVVGSGTATLVVTGLTGFPLFRMTIVRGGTAAETFATKAPNATAGTALSHTSGVITVTTAAAHGLATGAVVSITTATGFTFTRDGVATVASIDKARIHVTAATTFTLIGVVGSGTNTGTIVITVLPSESAGTYAKVLAETAEQGAILAPNSGRQYTKYTFEYANPVSSLNSIARNQAGTHIVFVDDLFDSATPTNFIAFNTGVANIVGGFTVNSGSASTTVNAELLSAPLASN